MSAIVRGLQNPFRNRVRIAVVVVLLAAVIGLFAVLIQGALGAVARLVRIDGGVVSGVIKPRIVRRCSAGLETTP